MSLESRITDFLSSHKNVHLNLPRKELTHETVARKEVLVTKSGALAVWTAPESTGRAPLDTVSVRRTENEKTMDWTAANNRPITEETFDIAFTDALGFLGKRKDLFIVDRVIGADSTYALPVRVITDSPLTCAFADNMFRPIPKDIEKSIFHKKGFTLVVVPKEKLDTSRYEGRLRKLANGKTTDMIVALDFERRAGVIIGSAYCGSVKKALFTVMNYLLPLNGILPLHCSSNEGKKGDCALMLGLSGTGKTTLSADPHRALLGDDEHGWNDHGIANFENGVYAKMININPKKEPDIYEAVMHDDSYLNHCAIVENAMVYPNGTFDYNDNRFTANSRASFPLTFLKNIKPSSTSTHPSTIVFLTADAYGVLPPVSKLNEDQAMLWFLMGYTSKLEGTETGVTDPEATFSRFFGAPFMPLNPETYARMLGEKIRKHKSTVYLVNTGWTGGPYGIGKRIDIPYTRAMIEAALNGSLEKVSFVRDEIFHLDVPTTCPNVPSEVLIPSNIWHDRDAYIATANKLAKKFSDAYDKAYGNKNIAESIKKCCPGK